MCTNKGAQREGRFRRLEGFLSKRPDQNPNNNTLSSEKVHFDEGQITHLICARLKYDLYDFFRGCFWAFSTRKRTGSRPKTPPKKVI